MKTLLSSGLVGLSLFALACSGGDDDRPEATTAAPAAATPALPATPSGINAGNTAMPASVSDPVVAPDPITPVTPEVPEVLPPPTLAVVAELDWRPCGQFDNRNIECAELNVPVDYADTDGEQLTLGLRRVLANPLEPHRGSLLFNPGGPGGAGIDLALELFEGGIFNEIAPGFDIIGFDPRGVGESGERGCGIYPADMYPDVNQKEPADMAEAIDALVGAYHDQGADCEKEWGPLFRKLGSNNVVRDMEEIRKALKEPLLNFFGASYGTRLGALYAHEYPQTTGRIVLDAPVHPRANFVELVMGQLRQTLALNEALFVRCEAGSSDCPTNARQLFDQIVANATARGLEGALAGAWKGSLASTNGLRNIFAAFRAEIADPGGDWITSFLSGASDGNAGYVVYASVSCTDDTIEPPTPEQLASVLTQAFTLSPLFAPAVTEVARCAGWPTTRDPVPLETAIDARPILVIGGTQDLRTPYEWAPAMTETLGNATLLTSNHYGHVAVANGSQCAKQIVRAYLTSGSLPASGAVCD